MNSYKVTLGQEEDGSSLLKLAFGEPASNVEIVVDAVTAIHALDLKGGRLIRINGPASLPVAVAISHEVGHKYGVVAVWDPKIGKYVVAISHDPDLRIGDLID